MASLPTGAPGVLAARLARQAAACARAPGAGFPAAAARRRLLHVGATLRQQQRASPPPALRRDSDAPAARLDDDAAAAGVSSLLAQDDRLSVIHAHDKYGFTVNGIHMRGSVLVFPHFTLLWNVTSMVDVCPRNAAVVHMVRPKPELLLLGTGEDMENINPSLFAYFQRRGVSVEPMSTVSVCVCGGVLG
jgi:uncharacterized protein